jgi:hypothetical protein
MRAVLAARSVRRSMRICRWRLCWLLIDREVATGGTPATLYSQLPRYGGRADALAVGRRRLLRAG